MAVAKRQQSAILQTLVRSNRGTGFGRLGEVANGCFVALQFAESGFG
jgi:hypothetical protein